MSITKRTLLKEAYDILESEAILTLDTEALEGVAIKRKYDILNFLDRTKEHRELIRISNIKLNELSEILSKAKEHYNFYGHSEVRQVITLLDNLIKEQIENKEIYQFEIIQIKGVLK